MGELSEGVGEVVVARVREAQAGAVPFGLGPQGKRRHGVGCDCGSRRSSALGRSGINANCGSTLRDGTPRRPCLSLLGDGLKILLKPLGPASAPLRMCG